MAAFVAARQLRGVVKRVTLQGTSLAPFGTRTVSDTFPISSAVAGRRRSNELSIFLPRGLSLEFKRGSEATGRTGTPDLDWSEALSKLSLSPAEIALTNEYVLPALRPHSNATILDPAPRPNVRDCPAHVRITDDGIMDAPPMGAPCRIETPPGPPAVEKHARRIMKIRHRKMKRHKYKKWRKRNKFKIRAILLKRGKRKLKIWQARLDTYRFRGLTDEYVDWHLGLKRDELKIYLKHLGIPLEEEATDRETERMVEERLRAQKRKDRYRYLPGATMKMVPEPVLPERSSLKIMLAEQERRAASELTGDQ